MSVTNVTKDPSALTLTITAEFDAPAARVWELWKNPRQLERWWGPPTYPATFEEHHLSPGGTSSYFMTGPKGDRSHGWWRVLETEAPHRLEFESGIADETGQPNPSIPAMTVRVTLSEPSPATTRMQVETRYQSVESMELMMGMGMAEGMKMAIEQIDDLLRGERREPQS